MFISRNLVFIELHKTGCTHIGKLLAQLVGGQQISKHNPPPAALLQSGRRFIGSIRNPWEWYLSLWAFGCGKQGSVYEHTSGARGGNPSGRARDWQRSYADVHDAAAFRDWLHMMHDENYWNDYGEGYGASSLNRFAGLLTYRYMYLFCRFTNAGFSSIESLKAYEMQNCYINHFIRTEHLEEDLLRTLGLIGLVITDDQRKTVYAVKKTNASAKRKATASYYDDDTVQLVRDREQLIIDRFSYSFPAAQGAAERPRA